MPRKMSRIEPTWQRPTWAADDEYTRTTPDAVPVNGYDPTATHRAMMRARTTAAQQAERQKHDDFRAHQVAVLADEAARSYKRPRGAGWPQALRSIREGRPD
jgi:hypothetical protein